MTKTSVAHPMVEILENIMHCSCFEVEHVWTDPAALVRRRLGRDYVKVKFPASADTEWTVPLARK
jgi:hypothetical protein